MTKLFSQYCMQAGIKLSLTHFDEISKTGLGYLKLPQLYGGSGNICQMMPYRYGDMEYNTWFVYA